MNLFTALIVDILIRNIRHVCKQENTFDKRRFIRVRMFLGNPKLVGSRILSRDVQYLKCFSLFYRLQVVHFFNGILGTEEKQSQKIYFNLTKGQIREGDECNELI